MAGNSSEAGTRTETLRPEAKALRWSDLLPNNQKAVGRLIRWLYAASVSAKSSAGPGGVKQGEQQLSTSVLISGTRGVGKSTVLLSTRHALSPRGDDFFRTGPGADGARGDQVQELSNKLGFLRGRLCWLDTLDMEPLPQQTNLLATLLVRVREVLQPPESDRRERWAPASLLEEGLDQPWGQIQALIQDAAFMWEEFPSSGRDPRQRAQDQIKAAEIYASFRDDFSRAIEAVSRLLAERKFGRNGQDDVILVLPIDNVDRSVEHLQSIFKLMRMVASGRLWFALASDESVFRLFLERSFQAELCKPGSRILGARSEDEIVAIARRQADAVMRRVLPPTHCIEIEPLAPQQAWSFEAAPILADGSGDRSTLRARLRAADLCWRHGGEADGLEHFADLFDIRPRMLGPHPHPGAALVEAYEAAEKDALATAGERSRDEPGEGEPLFTQAGKLALSLSARTALDLWQAAGEGCDGERVISIAKELLQTTVDESNLPAWASEQLHNRLLRSDAGGRTLLDLSGGAVRRLEQSALYGVLELYPEPDTGFEASESRILRSELHLRRFQEIILEQHDLEQPDRKIQLPPSVTGWFMLLHDLLVLSGERRVLASELALSELIPGLVVTRHEARLEGGEHVALDFWWPLPGWNTFIDFEIFIKQWGVFLHQLEDAFRTCGGEKRAGDRHLYFQLVLAAWLDNICSVAGPGRGGWSWDGLRPLLPPGDGEWTLTGEGLQAYVKEVFNNLEKLLVHEDSRGYGRPWIVRQWLANALPLMRAPEYFPENQMTPSWWLRLAPRCWEGSSSLLEQLRRDQVRAALERSRAYRALRRSCGPATGASASQLRDWIERALGTWFGLERMSGREHWESAG